MDNMSAGEKITQELSLGNVVSKTFELYRRDFLKFVILFLVVEAIVGVLTTLVQRAIVLPAVPSAATSQQILNWLPGFFGALIALIALTAIVELGFLPRGLRERGQNCVRRHCDGKDRSHGVRPIRRFENNLALGGGNSRRHHRCLGIYRPSHSWDNTSGNVLARASRTHNRKLGVRKPW